MDLHEVVTVLHYLDRQGAKFLEGETDPGDVKREKLSILHIFEQLCLWTRPVVLYLGKVGRDQYHHMGGKIVEKHLISMVCT